MIHDPRVMWKMMFYVIVTILVCTYVFGNENSDLTGTKHPVDLVVITKDGEQVIVKKEGMDITSTGEKVIEILDKIEKVEIEKDKIYYDSITTIEPKDAADQYCYVKVIIKQKGNNLIKEEILECADGRKKVDGPSYWELFAQFYYRDIYTPEYCRWYNRAKHAFKSPGKVCLNVDGEWEVK